METSREVKHDAYHLKRKLRTIRYRKTKSKNQLQQARMMPCKKNQKTWLQNRIIKTTRSRMSELNEDTYLQYYNQGLNLFG